MKFWKPAIFLMVVVSIPDIRVYMIFVYIYIYMYICLKIRDNFQAANRNIV